MHSHTRRVRLGNSPHGQKVVGAMFLSPVAYLESVKVGGPGGLRTEVPSGVQGPLTLFVTECLNFDVLEEKS